MEFSIIQHRQQHHPIDSLDSKYLMGKINSLLDHGVILVSTSDFSFSLLICQFFKENNKLLHEGCKIKWQG